MKTELNAIIAGLCMLALPALGLAQADSSDEAHALPLNLEWGPGVSDQGLRSELNNIVNVAMNIVRSYPPGDSDNLFSWKGDRAVLADKTFTLSVTMSDDPILSSYGARTPGGILPQTDAVTSLGIYGSGSGASAKITTFLIVDRVFYDEQKAERIDSFERCVAALGHGIYGNVQSYLKMDIRRAEPPSIEDRNRQEIAAFQAGVDFLERLTKSDKFQEFGADVQSKFADALARERAELKFRRAYVN